MSRTSGADGPEDVDATFEQIVADLRAEGLGIDGQDDPNNEGASEQGNSTQAPQQSDERAKTQGQVWRDSGTNWDDTMFGTDLDDDEHYVPPEPPPLPKPRKGAFVVLLFFLIGLLLLIRPSLIGLTSTIATPMGLLALTAGIALLLLRVKQGPPDGSDTNGAQV